MLNSKSQLETPMPAVSAARAARRNASAKKKLAQDRRNAMSQMSHRKSLVRGIISVASGEVRQIHSINRFLNQIISIVLVTRNHWPCVSRNPDLIVFQTSFILGSEKRFMSREHHSLWSIGHSFKIELNRLTWKLIFNLNLFSRRVKIFFFLTSVSTKL